MQYDTLAAVYEFTVPDSMLTPARSVAAFASVIAELRPGALGPRFERRPVGTYDARGQIPDR